MEINVNFVNESIFITTKNHAPGQMISGGTSSLEAHILRGASSRGEISLEADIRRGE